jgi:hypothetical protein
MRMLAEYLENAITFEQLAAAETDAKLKANLERQALRTESLRKSTPKKTSRQREASRHFLCAFLKTETNGAFGQYAL